MSLPHVDLPRDLRSRWKVGPIVTCVVIALLALLLGSLFMPVCVPIPKSSVTSFESVVSLEERALGGEPFKKKNGRWYQCKSRLARAFF